MEKKWWTLVVVCAATFMLLVGHHHRDRRVADHPVRTAREFQRRAVGHRRLRLDLGVGTADRRIAGRPLRAPTAVHRRSHCLHPRLVALRGGPVADHVDRVPQRPRHRWGDPVRHLAGSSGSELPRQGTGDGLRNLGCGHGVAAGLGPVLGGVITDGISWRGIFLVNLPVGVAALVITRWQVDESKTPHASRPDWAGFATLTAGLISLVYGLIRAGEMAWSDTGVAICLALAAVFFVAFVALERRADHPLFDLSLFRIPTFSGGLAAAFAMNGSLYAMFLYLVLYLQDDLGYSALATGMRILLISGISIVSSIFAGVFSERMPVRWLIGPGLLLVGVGLLLMTGLDGASSWTHLIPGFIVAGVGSGIVNPPLASTAVGVVAPQRSGMASGVNTTFRQIGIATGIAVYGSVFAAALRHKLGQALAGVPSLERHLPGVVTAIQQGNAAQAINAEPGPLRAPLVAAIHASFAGALDVLLVVSGVLALVGAACSGALIRRRDFVVSHPQPTPAPTETLGSPVR